MPDTSKVEVLFYKASNGAIFCLQGVGATLQIRFDDLLCKRHTCMADCKANHFFPSVQATRCIFFVGQVPWNGEWPTSYITPLLSTLRKVCCKGTYFIRNKMCNKQKSFILLKKLFIAYFLHYKIPSNNVSENTIKGLWLTCRKPQTLVFHFVEVGRLSTI